MSSNNASPQIISRPLFGCMLALACLAAAISTTRADDKAWENLPKILSRITPPSFPNREFVVTNYGAVGDGTTDSSAAFSKAIEACHNAGGGKVIVPAGIFLTGPIHLKSGVNLCVETNATIRFSTNPKDYLPVVLTRFEGTEVMNYSPLIYAFEQKNIAITGEGTLDGQANDTTWHDWKNSSDPRQLVQMGNRGVPAARRIFGDGHHLRPNFVQPFRCRNVLIEGVRIVNSPMWVLNPVYCKNVVVRNVTVDTKGPNTDGCDPDSCSGVLVTNCSFSDGDDCVAIKSGRDQDGQRISIPCENLVFRDCDFHAGHGGIALGSETSGGVRNVFAENCRFDSPNLEMALRLKTNPARGGYIENVFVRNCTVKTAQIGIHMTLRYGSSGAIEGKSVPVIRNVDIEDTTFAKLTKRPIFIEGWSPKDQITDIKIANCRFSEAPDKSFLTNATRVFLPGTQGSGLERDTY